MNWRQGKASAGGRGKASTGGRGKASTGGWKMDSRHGIGDPLVTVIVPVYNVAPYLEECIGSILRQTFRDYELLLIDDGSTDQSGLICRRAAESDRRIRYFYKENGGLSRARNYGLDRARGEYITFIDSDDYVMETYLQTLLDLCLTWSAHLSCVDFLMPRQIKGKGGRPGKRDCMTPVEALRRCLVRDGFGLSACGKMYHRSLTRFLHFPPGRRYEDLLTIPWLFEKCDRVAAARDRLYYYRRRQGSITCRKLDQEDFCQPGILLDLLAYVDEYAPEIHDAAVCRLLVELFHNIIYRLVFDERYPLLAGRLSRICRRFLKESGTNPYLSRGKKLQIKLFCRNPALYKRLYSDYLKYKKNVKFYS